MQPHRRCRRGGRHQRHQPAASGTASHCSAAPQPPVPRAPDRQRQRDRGDLRHLARVGRGRAYDSAPRPRDPAGPRRRCWRRAGPRDSRYRYRSTTPTAPRPSSPAARWRPPGPPAPARSWRPLLSAFPGSPRARRARSLAATETAAVAAGTSASAAHHIAASRHSVLGSGRLIGVRMAQLQLRSVHSHAHCWRARFLLRSDTVPLEKRSRIAQNSTSTNGSGCSWLSAG